MSACCFTLWAKSDMLKVYGSKIATEGLKASCNPILGCLRTPHLWKVCASLGTICSVSTNGKLVNLEPDDWGKRLYALIRRGLIWAGYVCLGMAFWILGWNGTFMWVLWLTGIGAALQLAHLLPKPPEDLSPDDTSPSR
jgi:hypothetical protein